MNNGMDGEGKSFGLAKLLSVNMHSLNVTRLQRMQGTCQKPLSRN